MEFVGMVDTNGQVAPFTGAWIEILIPCASWPVWSSSHPSRVRGLKYFSGDDGGGGGGSSHPSRVRGLKSSNRTLHCTGYTSRTLHGCVD